MRIFQYLSPAILAVLLVACQTATPSPIMATIDSEFTLALDQSVTIENTGLGIRLIGVTDDQRCPSEIECVMSGPVSLTISIQTGSDPPAEFALQTFTSNNGRAPERTFEGIENRVDYEGYVIQVTSVLPYPARSFDEIKDLDYRVSFLVTEK